MALVSTQPLTQMSTRNISWGKGGRCVRLTTLPPSCAVVMKSGSLNFLELSGTLQACNGTALLYRTRSHLFFYLVHFSAVLSLFYVIIQVMLQYVSIPLHSHFVTIKSFSPQVSILRKYWYTSWTWSTKYMFLF